MTLRKLVDEVLGVVLPNQCAGCGRRGAVLCGACEETLRPAPGAPAPAPLEWWTACFAYEGAAREIVARAKYRGERAALRLVARRVADAARASPIAFDVVTWAPASRDRYARSGVDHGALIARTVARAHRKPVRRLLVRDAGPPQTGRPATNRRAGPPLRVVQDPLGLIVLVVDDVATTGGTLAAAARALRAHGARAVVAATIARTPRPGEHTRNRPYTSSTKFATSRSVDSPEDVWTSSSSASTRKSTPR